MKSLSKLALSLLLATVAPFAVADGDRDESGKGGGSYKQEYSDGNCKIERKMKNGSYKEEIKCKGGAQPVYAPAPAPASPAVIIDQTGVTVQGAVRISR